VSSRGVRQLDAQSRQRERLATSIVWHDDDGGGGGDGDGKSGARRRMSGQAELMVNCCLGMGKGKNASQTDSGILLGRK